jgi:hypothetical protein
MGLLGRRLALVCATTAVGLAAVPAVANAAASWQEGPLVESQVVDCITGQVEQGAGAYLSYYADPANPPKVGQVYYIGVDLAGIGDPCAGGSYASVNLVMPPGTAPAIDASHPVKCFMNLGKGWGNVAQNCPQSLPIGPYGYEVNPINSNPPFWPLAPGVFAEIQIPVVSTQPLIGTSSQRLQGYIQLADGQDNPTLTPQLSMIVNPANAATSNAGNGTGGSQIGVSYANPSITSNVQQANTSTTVGILGYVRNNSNPGYAYAQVGYADSAGDCTNPIAPHLTGTASGFIETNQASLQNPQTQISGNLTGLYADVAYCWRLVGVVTSGPQAGTYYGNWEYFVTNGTYHQYSNEPSAAKPPAASTGCSTNGSGCATSSCTNQCTTSLSPSGAGPGLTVSLAGTGGGSVSDGKFIACPTKCSATYLKGAKVTLTATPSSGSTFAGWSGGGCSGTGQCTVAMESAQTVSAIFNALPGGGNGGTGGNGGGGPGGTAAAVLRSVTALLHQTLKSAIANGVIFNVGCAGACRVTIRLFVDGVTAGRLHLASDARARRKQKLPVLVGSATTTLSGAGSKKIGVKLSRSARRAFSHLKSVKLTASALATGSAGTSSSQTFGVTLHR